MRALTDKWIETQIRKALSRANFALSGLGRFIATSTGGAVVGEAVKIVGAGSEPGTAAVAPALADNVADQAAGVILAFVGTRAIVVSVGEVRAYFGALTPGAIYYLDATTPGAITPTAPAFPNITQIIGRAIDSSTLLVMIEEVAAGGGAVVLAGNVVGPSSANRVVELSGDSVNLIVALDSGATIRQIQGGTPAAPKTEIPLIFESRPTTDGFAKANYATLLESVQFLTTFDEVYDVGYNTDNSQPTLPTARWTIESDFEFAPGLHQMEMHAQYSTLGAGAGVTYRWLSGQFRPSTLPGGTNFGAVFMNWHDGVLDPGSVSIGETTASTPAVLFTTAATTFNGQVWSATHLGAWSMSGGTQTSDAATNNMIFAPQAPFAGATGGNRDPGNFEIEFAVPVAGGLNGNFQLRRAANIFYEALPGSTTWADAAGTGYFEIVLSGTSTQLVGISPGTMYVSNNNGALQATATTGVYLLAGAGDQCHFFVAGTELAQVAANAVANQTSLVVACDAGNTLLRVTLGIANSGGVGFRVLRVPN